MSPWGWRLLGEYLTSGASRSQAITQIVGMDLTRPVDDPAPGMPIKINTRIRVVRIALEPRIPARCAEIARRLLLVSNRNSHEFIGLVVEAYLTGQIKGSELHVEPIPIQETKYSTRDVYLSRLAWDGLIRKFGRKPSIALRRLVEEHARFERTTIMISPRRRHVHHLHISTKTLEYYAARAKELGIMPQAHQGLISWASLFLEYLGAGGIQIANLDREEYRPQPKVHRRIARARTFKPLNVNELGQLSASL